jgi:hypothetical protein
MHPSLNAISDVAYHSIRVQFLIVIAVLAATSHFVRLQKMYSCHYIFTARYADDLCVLPGGGSVHTSANSLGRLCQPVALVYLSAASRCDAIWRRRLPDQRRQDAGHYHLSKFSHRVCNSLCVGAAADPTTLLVDCCIERPDDLRHLNRRRALFHRSCRREYRRSMRHRRREPVHAYASDRAMSGILSPGRIDLRSPYSSSAMKAE